ncbi:hypothetical protein FISHEDRAFT_21311, partial [Fistulina hepatica ATCC 64428]
LPPSSFLPSLRKLDTLSAQDILEVVHRTNHLYWPPSRPLPLHLSLPVRHHKNLIHDTAVPDSGYASCEEDDGELCTEVDVYEDDDMKQALDVLQNDPMERAFVIKWATGLITRSDIWLQDVPPDEAGARVKALDDVSALLSTFSGSAEDVEVPLTRLFSFPRADGSPPIDVVLNDAPLSGDDHTAVGLQSWGSCIVLAEQLCHNPMLFGISPSRQRILELGAGTGMLSIVIAKLFPTSTVVATDFHPDVLDNLTGNVSANFLDNASSPCVSVLALDWSCPEFTGLLVEPFDVILAADVVYYADHARWIKTCIVQLLARPSPDNPAGGVFWLIIPIRPTGRHEGMDRTVEDVVEEVDRASETCQLMILGVEEVQKHKGIGRADEGGYKLYKIGYS